MVDARAAGEDDLLHEARNLLHKAWVFLSDHAFASEESGHVDECDDCKAFIGEVEEWFERQADESGDPE